MSRGFYNSSSTPFLYTGGEAVGPGMDCLQLRQPPGPFHYLISEQAKSLVALQELQHEVGALLEFRDLVIETFPNLRTKLATASTPATMTSSHHHHLVSSNIPVSIRTGDWTPGVRVRKKLASNKDDAIRSNRKIGDTTAVQDSGFSTETSSKETHSASSTVPAPSSSATGAPETDETEDELWNLLDVIHRKGTRLKDEVEALQGALRDQDDVRHPEDDGGGFRRALFRGSADDVRQLRQERDLLLDRLAEMEAEVLAGRVHTHRLQEDLEHLLAARHDLEQQLKAVVSQRGEVNSRIHDLHLQFVAKNQGDDVGAASGQRTKSKSALDSVLGDRIPKVANSRVPDSDKIAAILKERNPLVLQKHLLTSTVQNQVLNQELDTAARLKLGLTDKLDKAKEENEELRFQLEDKSIELEGTRARVRLLEQLHRSTTPSQTTAPSPDVIPDRPASRSEITTASMKAMSPLPANLQMDHSSSTESAHDQAESARRRPSRIPLKSYTAPRPPPPGGKQHSPAPGARSRSGDSAGRPHSAQSWRRGEGNSLQGAVRSRNGSLVSTTKDSLSQKLRGSGSPTRQGRGAAIRTAAGAAGEKILSSISAKEKSRFPWTLCSYGSDLGYLDSLDRSLQTATLDNTTTSSGHQHFQTANTFLWTAGADITDFYDSIDSNLASSLYQPNGEELADCDSLEIRQLSDLSDKK